MKYSQKYPSVRRGMHAPDEHETIYRVNELGQCANCGALTDWADVTLQMAVCSEECQYQLATARQRVRRVGELLVKDGLITEAQLQEALRIQPTLKTYTPIGQVLIDGGHITLRQLNAVLDKYGKRPPLGRILLTAKVISEPQLESALAHQRKTGLRLGEALLQLGFVSEPQLKRAVCVQRNVPFVDLGQVTPDPSLGLGKLIKRSYAKQHRVIPIAKLGNNLTVAMDDPTDVGVVAMLEASTGCTINVVTSTRVSFLRAFARMYGDESGGPAGTR